MHILGFKILYNYPAWFVILCLLAGLVYSGILYYKSTTDGFPKITTWFLAFARFASVAILSWLLLSPLVQRLTRHVDAPILIVVQDNSQSITLTQDTLFDLDKYMYDRDAFIESMNADFDVLSYRFGEVFREDEQIDFSDRITDMASVFSGIDDFYSNRNIGAVVLASDGIFNRGMHPVYISTNLPYPVYTIALGDTIPHRDVVLSRIRHNRITYLGNLFPVEVHVEAREAAGMNSRLTISRDGQVLFSEVLTFTSEYQFETVMAELEAEEVGLQRYRVELSAVDGEVNLDNNIQEFYIEVIDSRQKVLILANAPHPDIGAIRMALEANDNYEVSVFLVSEFDGTAMAYNLVILHQLPSSSWPLDELFSSAQTEDIPVLFVVGAATDLQRYNSLRTGIGIDPRADDMVETLPVYNNSFTLFALSEQTMGLIDVLPPLFSPFARYEVGAGSQIMLHQRIGQVTTDQPLIGFSQASDRKYGLITGEGIWRWRLHAYHRDQNHMAFDDMMSRIVQYLSVQEDKSLFRIDAEQFVYEHENVLIEAELYNRSYELVNDPEVRATIINEAGVSFPYVMTRTSNAYQLDAGAFPPADYILQVNTSFGGEQFSAEARFSVLPLNLEGLKTIADHNLLFQISENTGAMMVYPGQWDMLQDHLLGRDDINPVMYARKTFDEVINIKWFFMVILLLLTMEWFIRKRSGSY
jgi:hypothetical protein